MALAKQGDTVTVHYTGILADGTVFDSSANRDPLQFTIGEGNIIPALEQAVIGMSPGESRTETVTASQAYGPHRTELVLEIDRGQIPADLNPQIDQQFQIRLEDEQTVPVVVTGMSESTVTFDANHPLAGKDLTFQIQLIEVT